MRCNYGSCEESAITDLPHTGDCGQPIDHRFCEYHALVELMKSFTTYTIIKAAHEAGHKRIRRDENV